MKKIITKIVCAALGILAWMSSFVGCMEWLETKSFFGLGETAGLVFTLSFSILVGAFSFQGFKDFIANIQKEHEKK